ncbi:MAG: hypothetical protein ABSG99_03610 [Sedimentisphaerales bacterium]
MKINSTVFTVIVISLVAIASYYIGVSNQRGNPNQQSIPSNTLPIIPNQAKAIEVKPEPCIPNYQSKMDNQRILTGVDAKPSTLQVITVPSQPNNRVVTMLPSPPKDALDILNLRYKLYQGVAKAEYEKDMTNAGAVNGQPGDSLLVQNAQQRYALNIAEIETWHQVLDNKFKIISEGNYFNNSEKEMMRRKVLSRASDPIYVPKSAYEKVELTVNEPKQ